MRKPERLSRSSCGKPTPGGWTLTELLITLGVVATLAALALPAYQQQQRQARRSDGQAALLRLQIDQARWRSSHDSYADHLAHLGWTQDLSPQGHYRISLSQASADGYSAQAQPMGAQAQDLDCAPLRLRWQGTATPIYGAGEHESSDPRRCWSR